MGGWAKSTALSAAAVLLACSGSVHTSAGASATAGSQAQAGGGASAAGQGGTGGAGIRFVAAESVARRLSRAELDHVVRDLLGDDEGAASRLLPEDPYSPYDNDYTGQRASSALIDSYAELAADIAARIVGTPELRARLLPCTPASDSDGACFAQAAQRLTRRAFRRALSDSELAPYLGLLDFASEEIEGLDTGFDTALTLLLSAVLMDPELLYRIEVGEPTDDPRVFALDGIELAARLSFLVWGSLPDDALLEQAEAGELASGAGRRAALSRMLEDPRANAQVRRFHAMWLGYRVIPHAPQLAAAFARETSALLDRVIFEERGSVGSLFTYAETFIDGTLAEHYGLPAPEDDEGWVPYGDSGRAGILSHGAVLAAFGKFSDTSPTQRGILVRSRLLCEPIAPPPPTVMADRPPGDMDAVCKWDRYAEHRASDACRICHEQMDPIGFGLERFDLAGRYREHDEGLPQCAIDGEGTLPPYGSFSGPGELGALLVASGVLERCVVSQVLQFALGRPLQASERGFVDALTAQMMDADGSLLELLGAYVESEAFALRKEPAL